MLLLFDGYSKHPQPLRDTTNWLKLTTSLAGEAMFCEQYHSIDITSLHYTKLLQLMCVLTRMKTRMFEQACEMIALFYIEINIGETHRHLHWLDIN